MFDFGDELIIDSYRIPWLIWIQLLVMFLLAILLFYLSTTPTDPSVILSASTAPSPSSGGLSFANNSLLTTAGANTYLHSKVGGSRSNEIASNGNVRQTHGSSTAYEGNPVMVERSHHPCHFFGLAKKAFLKCLGIDSTPDNTSTRQHEKES